jgi:murein DD-endopeptidase MepM/ murein hydrolase activator NlpD
VITQTAAASLFSFLGTQVVSGAVTMQGEYVVYENSQTITLLRAARNIDPNLSRGGGGPSVVEGVSLTSENGPFSSLSIEQTTPASPDQISWYIVQEGDTLSQVAELFGVSVNTIVWANELLHSEDIHPGETLLILPISGIQHTIAEGDTLKSIAKEYGGGADADELEGLVEEILEYNGLVDGSALVVGEEITVPGGMMEVEYAESTTYAYSGTSGGSSGTFIHPIPGAVRTQGIHGYNAVDFGAAVGAPIRASDSGTVIVSRVGGWNGGYGNYIVIDHHDGTQTLYAHLSRNVVWQGQSVVSGQKIGEVGNTGRSTGPHLHFEVRGSRNPF